MTRTMKKFILDLMKTHNIMTIATVRKDGYPQATTVTYANNGLTIYFAADNDSQKVKNISRCNKVSLTIDRDYADWNKTKGLSMAATARLVTDKAEWKRALRLLMKKFPALAGVAEQPAPSSMAIVRVTPKVISVINYTLGFGHTDLIKV